MPLPHLIKSYVVDLAQRQVVLSMPDIDPHIAESVKVEMQALNTRLAGNATISCQHENNQLTINVSSSSTAHLGLACTQIMTRKVQTLEEGGLSQPTKYSPIEGTLDVLETLATHDEIAQSSHLRTAFERLKDAARQTELM